MRRVLRALFAHACTQGRCREWAARKRSRRPCESVRSETIIRSRIDSYAAPMTRREGRPCFAGASPRDASPRWRDGAGLARAAPFRGVLVVGFAAPFAARPAVSFAARLVAGFVAAIAAPFA